MGKSETSFIKHFFKGITFTVEGIVMVFFLIGFVAAMLSPFISPKSFFLPAFCNLSYPFWYALLWALFLFSLVRKNLKRTLFYLLLIVLSFNYTRAYFPINLPSKTSDDSIPKISVMTYNLMGLARSMDNGYDALDLINEKEPDIVCLQECNPTTSLKKNISLVKKKVGNNYPYIHIHSKPKNHSQGLAFLSKYPIEKIIPIDYPSIGNGSVIYILKLSDNEKAIVANNHMESYSLTQTEKASIKGMVKNDTFSNLPKLFNKLSERLGPKLSIRADAAKEVRTAMDSLTTAYNPKFALVCGDLNDTPYSYTYYKLKGNFNDAFKSVGNGLGVTYNERFFWFRIDHIFYQGALKPTKAEIVRNAKLSDHNPLIIDFEATE